MIRFRPIQRTDLPTLSRWLDAPHVRRWWADPSDLASLEAAYGPSIDGDDPTEVFIASDGDGDFGLIQRYAYGGEPEYARELAEIIPVTDGDWSIDYLIGDADRIGAGLGTAMIRAFIELLSTDHPDVRRVVVPVHAENERSWRALRRAGFRLAARGELDPDNPADTRDHVVMEYRPPIAGPSS